MRLARTLLPCAAALLLCASAARADSILEEHVTGGALDRVWVNGFDTSNNMQPLTLSSGDPAWANPSGDHTVAAAVNALPDSGGLIVTVTDPQGVKDYKWDAWVFTGAGDSRRGLIV